MLDEILVTELIFVKFIEKFWANSKHYTLNVSYYNCCKFSPVLQISKLRLMAFSNFSLVNVSNRAHT